MAQHGDVEHEFRVASITKLPVALAALVAVEEEVLDLDEVTDDPPGATVRHLIAHASGLNFDDDTVLSPPGRRRMYSNTGWERLGRHLAQRADMPVADYLRQAVLEPLGLTRTELRGSVAKDLWSTLEETGRFAGELLRPTVVAPETLRSATEVAFPGLAGVLPGVGRYDPLDWGLGFDLPGHRGESFAGSAAGEATFGHFGGAGTFLWVDPELDLACVVLTDREFDDWALTAWPELSDGVRDRFGRS